MTTQSHAPVSDYQRDVLQALADGYTLEVLSWDSHTECTLMKEGEVALPLNSARTFYALRRYLVPTLNGIGIARYTLNDAGRDVLSSAGS